MSKLSSELEVPFNALGRGTSALRAEIDSAIERVVSSGWYVLGPEHDEFEKKLAGYLNAGHVVGVGNGTDALQIALTGLGVSRGDEVLTAANAGGYTSTAARSIGAVPVYADVDAESLLLTVQTIDQAVHGLGHNPKVIVVTHLFGAVAPIHEIVSWAHARGIAVVEDCAQSLGATAGIHMAGTIADVATTSFYPTKNLGALGDGGAIMTSSDDLAARLRELRQYGWTSKYRTSVDGGRNSRLDELQAAILLAKLPHLDGWNERRREIHSAYEGAISSAARLINKANPGFVGHLAVIEVSDRDSAREIFTQHGVKTDVHYPIPDHRQPVAQEGPSFTLPVTENAADHILSIPLFPELTEIEIKRVSTALSEL